ncbi:MAG: hypothetical protein AMXMBFR79_11190 [Chitinophagaceae bacterium]
MYCRNCGNEVHEKAVACPKCGVNPRSEKKFCNSCGAETNSNQVICVTCGAMLTKNSFSLSDMETSFNLKNNEVTKQIGFWGAVLCFLGFFLPWIDVWIIDGNGFTVATKALNRFAFFRIVLLAIPIISGVFIFNLMKGKFHNSFQFLKFVPLTVFVISIFVIFKKIGRDFDDIFDYMGVGIYMTLIGVILLCFTKPSNS